MFAVEGNVFAVEANMCRKRRNVLKEMSTAIRGEYVSRKRQMYAVYVCHRRRMHAIEGDLFA